MINFFDHRAWHYLLLVAASLLLFFVNLGGASLWDMDEGRNATCAMEMMASGNWIVPTFNGELRVDKPALLYWLQILAYQCFGINEFAARLPSALAALLTILCCYELGRSMFSRTTGILAGMIAATTPMMCGAARFANPDALLNLFAVSALTVFWLGRHERRLWWFVLMGVATGLGALAKGPVGFLLPAASGGAFLLWERSPRVLLDQRWLVAGHVASLVALPWHIWVGVETKGAFWRGFLMKHNLERGLYAMDEHGGFPGYYLVILLAGAAPWSIFLALSWWFGFWSAIRAPWPRWQSCWGVAADGPPSAPAATCNDHAAAYRLLAVWIAVYLVFFSIAATKLPNYVLPVVVPCAILIARYLERWQTGQLVLPAWILATQIAALVIGGVLLTLSLLLLGGVGEWSALRGRFFPGIEAWAFLGVIPIAVGLSGWWFLRARQYQRFTLAFTLGALFLFGPFAAFGLSLFDDCKAPLPLVEQSQACCPHEEIRIGSHKSDLASLNFYVKRPVEILDSENAAAEFLNARIPVFLFVPDETWQQMPPSANGSARVVGRHYDFYRHHEVVVVTNR